MSESTGTFEFGGGGGGGGGNGASVGRSSRGRPIVEVRLDKMFDRAAPQAAETEMAVLGAMLIDKDCIGDVIEQIRGPGEFYDSRHAMIYRAIVETYDRYHSADLIQLVNTLRDRNELDDIGGVEYLERLAEETPGSAAAGRWARIVSDKARLRELIKAAGETIFNAYHVEDEGEGAARLVIDEAERRIFAIAEMEERSQASALDDLLDQEIDAIEAMRAGGAPPRGPTYFTDLDSMTHGLQPGEMIIVAARPSMGKTAFALNLMEQIAMGEHRDGNGVGVGLFSLEMSKSAIVQRLLSAETSRDGNKGISTAEMRSGQLSKHDVDRLASAAARMSKAPIYIDDTPALSVMQLRAKARRMHRQFGVRALVIDYLQLMTAPGAARESRQVEVSAISRGIKALARELSVPVVCLSQLNRGPETRGENRPRMSDLRESGSIEQDADVVALLHREAYYHVGDREWEEENPDRLNVAELIIAKQRNGPTGTVDLVWDSTTTRFKNADRYHAADQGWGGGGGAGGWGSGGGGGGGTGGGGGWGAPSPQWPSSPGQHHQSQQPQPQKPPTFAGEGPDPARIPVQPAKFAQAKPLPANTGPSNTGPSNTNQPPPFDVVTGPGINSANTGSVPGWDDPPAAGGGGAGGGHAPGYSGQVFAPGRKSGPAKDHRDGGGPDRSAPMPPHEELDDFDDLPPV